MRHIEIIVAAKLYFKKEKFVTKFGSLMSEGGIIALFTSAIINAIEATAMQTRERIKKSLRILLRTFNVIEKIIMAG